MSDPFKNPIKPEYMPLIASAAMMLPQINPFAMPYLFWVYGVVMQNGIDRKEEGS